MKAKHTIRAALTATLAGALLLAGDSQARDRGDGPGPGSGSSAGGSPRWSGPSGAAGGSSGQSYYSDRGGAGSASGLTGRSWSAPSSIARDNTPAIRSWSGDRPSLSGGSVSSGAGKAPSIKSWSGERPALSGRSVSSGPGQAPSIKSWSGERPALSGRSVSSGAGKAPSIKSWSGERPSVSTGWSPPPTAGRSVTASNWRAMGNSGKAAGADFSTKNASASNWRTMGTGKQSVATGAMQRGTRATGATSSHLAAGGFFRDRRPIGRLPEGARSYDWHGHRYHHEGHHWWRPWWYGGDVYYYWCYPPIGYYYTDLPDDCSTVLIGGTPYYVSDGVYYGTAPDRTGYVVAEPPGGIPAADAGGEAGPPELTDEPAPAALGQLTPPEPPQNVDPYALLKAMADSLAGVPRLTLVVGDSFEDVAGDQRKELQGQFTLFLRRPDKLAVQYRGDMYDRNVYYDGTGVTLLNLRKNFFWRAAAPATIPAALETLARDYRVSMPLAELITADFGGLTASVREGRYLGADTVGDRTYHHLGFREDAVDWEVWLEADGPALPRRYAVTYKQLPGAPRYVATVVSWDTGPVPDSCFQLPAAPDPVGPR